MVGESYFLSPTYRRTLQNSNENSLKGGVRNTGMEKFAIFDGNGRFSRNGRLRDRLVDVVVTMDH